MAKRKTVKDWRKAWRDSIAKTQKIEADIAVRLKDLCMAHPEIVVGMKADIDRTPIKAKSIADLTYIKGLDTSAKLAFIEIIEKALADQHPHQQLTIKHVDVVPAPPVGERVLVNGKTGEAYKRSVNAVRILNPEMKDKRYV